MIKEVFNSITASSGSGRSSSLEQLDGDDQGKSETGFFGKMLMALQNEGGEKAKSGETGSGSSEKEEGSLESLLVTESKEGDKPVKLISNQEDQEAGEELETKNSAVKLTESQIDGEGQKASDQPVSVEEETRQTETISQEEITGDEITDKSEVENPFASADKTNVETGSGDSELVSEVSLKQDHQIADPDKEITLSSDSIRGGRVEQTEQASEGLEPGAGVNNDPVISEKEAGISEQPSNNGMKGETKDYIGVNRSPVNPKVADQSSEEGRSNILKEGSIQGMSAGKTESEKNINSNTVAVEKGQVSAAVNAEASKGIVETESEKGIDGSQKLNQAETPTGERRKFFDLNRTGKGELASAKKPMGENSGRVQVQQNTTSRDGTAIEHLSRDQSTKVDLKENPQLQAELTNAQKLNEERSKRYDLFNQNSDGRSISGERLAPVTSMSGSGSSQQGMGFNSQPSWIQFQANNQQATEFTANQQAFFNEQILESAEGTENGSNEQAKLNMNRLAEMPINNVILKRSVLPGLTGALQKATSAGKDIPQSWQKHSFDLDDGNKIELSTRNVDGVIQVKIASSSIELNKLMQQYGQEIKDHLEQESDLDIDLQFDGGQEETNTGFSDSSSSQKRGGNNHFSGNGSEKILNKKAEENLQQTVRKFGYNQMEWTI